MKLFDLFRRTPPPPPPAAPSERRDPVLNQNGHIEHIFIGAHSVALVKRLCATGRYLGPTDVLVTALRMLEEHEEMRDARRPGRAALPPADMTRK